MAGPMRQLAAGLMLLALACERPPARSRTGNDGAAPDVMGDAGDAPDTADFDAPSADTADAADTGGTADATADATDAADATADATDAADASSDAADAADADPGDADVDVPPNVSACGRATRPLQSLTVVPEIIKQIPSAYSLRTDGDGFAWLELPSTNTAWIWSWRPGDVTEIKVGEAAVLRGGSVAPYLLANSRAFFVQSTSASFGGTPPFRQLTVAVDRRTGAATTVRDAMDSTNPWTADDDFLYFGTTTRLFTTAVEGGTAAPLDIPLSKVGGFVRDGASLYVIDGGTSGQVQTDGGQWQQQLVADGRLLRYPVAGGAPDTLASGLVMPGHPMLLGGDVYFDVRRCTTPDYFTDAIAIVSKSGGPVRYLPIADEVVGSSGYVVDVRRGVSWIGWVEQPRHLVRNYRTSLDGRTVTKLENSAEAPWDTYAAILRTDDTFTWAWLPGQLLRWREP